MIFNKNQTGCFEEVVSILQGSYCTRSLCKPGSDFGTKRFLISLDNVHFQGGEVP